MNLIFKPLIAILIALALLIVPAFSHAQEILDAYIQEGVSSNLVLQKKQIGLEKAVYSLKTAKSYFMPSLNLNGGYTHGQGGRSINFPVGDMLNPVYSTLNELLNSSQFPQLQNVEQNFFPRNFYDVHVRASMPLINSDLHFNKSIQEDHVTMQGYEIKIYERELIKSIKTAYFSYLSALEAVKIYNSAMELLQQNVEVNLALLNNGKGLPASVLRAKSELEQVKAQLYDAENNVKNARRYFNFLLNKPHDSPIEEAAVLDPELEYVQKIIEEPLVQNREELAMVKLGRAIQQKALRMNQMYHLPKLNAFIDLGAQSENMQFNNRAPYYLLGLSLDVPLFNGFRNSYKIKQSSLDLKGIELELDYSTQQVDMAAEIAYNNLTTSYRNYESSKNQLLSAKSYFNLIEKGYKEGTNSMIEFIDGRNQLTVSLMQLNINTYKVMIALAEYERETASFVLE